MSKLTNLKNIITKMKPTFQIIKRITVLVAAMSFGFFAHSVYSDIKNRPVCQDPTPSETRVLEQTSVAINERNELLIIDRKTGTYETYNSSIGQTIFTLYANQIYSHKTESK